MSANLVTYIARLIGCDHTEDLLAELGGRTIYIPRLDACAERDLEAERSRANAQFERFKAAYGSAPVAEDGAWGCRCAPALPRFRVSGQFSSGVPLKTAADAVASMSRLGATVSNGRAAIEVETRGLGDAYIDALRTALAAAPVDVVGVLRITDPAGGVE